MRTLLLSEIFPPKHGGSGRWFWEIYSRLPRDEYTIVAGEDPGAAAFDGTHDLNLHRIPLAMPQWGIASVSALREYARVYRAVSQIVRDEKVTRLHVGRCLPEGWIAVMLKAVRGIPFSCYVHGEDVETAACSRELSWMVRRVLRRATKLIANSHNTARILRDAWLVPESQIAVLHPGCDTTRFIPAARRLTTRQSLGWGDRTVLLTVGRLQKRKGHDVLLRSLPMIREAVPDILSVIIGDGEERAELERITAIEGIGPQVRFLGEVDDATMIDCYQQSDLFVLPNRQVGRDIEGFGMVLVEAQSCGRPVVAGASGGTIETMRPGETGHVVPCDEPGPLAELIIRLLLDRRHLDEMGKAARHWASHRFDWRSLAAEARRVFDGAAVSTDPGTAPSEIALPPAAGPTPRDASELREGFDRKGWHAHGFAWACLTAIPMPTPSRGHATPKESIYPKHYTSDRIRPMLKQFLKQTCNAAAAACVLPAMGLYALGAALASRERAFPGWSQAFAQIPGITGILLRRAFYRFTLRRCESTTNIGYGTILSHPDTSLGSHADVGTYCVLGNVTIDDDCLIASRVSIINGLAQHSIDRLDIPVREQPGRFDPITIGRDSWIGEGAIIAANIGRHCVVGAGAVVTRPLPDFAIAAGVPARIVRFREPKYPANQRTVRPKTDETLDAGSVTNAPLAEQPSALRPAEH